MDLIKKIEESLIEIKLYDLWWFSEKQAKIINMKTKKKDEFLYTLNIPILSSQNIEKILVSSKERIIEILDKERYKILSPTEICLLNSPLNINNVDDEIFVSLPKLWKVYHEEDLPEIYSLKLTENQNKILSSLSKDQLQNLYSKNNVENDTDLKNEITNRIVEDYDISELSTFLVKLTRLNIETRAMMPSGFLSILPTKTINSLATDIDEFFKDYKKPEIQEDSLTTEVEEITPKK